MAPQFTNTKIKHPTYFIMFFSCQPVAFATFVKSWAYMFGSKLPLLTCIVTSLHQDSGSSPNGHSHKRKALLTATFRKQGFSQLPYKFCIFTFP